MKLSSFHFELPAERVAKQPVERGQARMMVLNKATGEITHEKIGKLIELFEEGDAVVLNDTRVFPAHLRGHKEKTHAKIDLTLLRELDPEHHLWDTLIEPARKIRVGNKLYFGHHDIVAEVIDNTTSRGRTLKFSFDGPSATLRKALEELGNPVIPETLRRKVDQHDKKRYQSIFADKVGAIVAPDAALHFTEYLLKYFMLQGVALPKLTLHTSLAFFALINAEDLGKYKVSSEYCEISQESCTVINQVKAAGKRVLSVGIDTLKALEGSVSSTGQLKPHARWTNKFIHPPYGFKIADALLTNFHLPKTTAFITTCAFGSRKHVMKAYQVAMQKRYRFHVYGDALLII